MTGKIEQGLRLRAWREHTGNLSGERLTLKVVAELIADEADRQSIARTSRMVPRTHASLTRWELGNVQQTIDGLGIIAKVYGVSLIDLMRMPPSSPAASL